MTGVRQWVLFLAGLLLGTLSLAAQAHFQLNLNVRVLHVEHLADGLRIYQRLPMPYLVADKVGPAEDGGLPQPAPFTRNSMEGDTLVHFLDAGAFSRQPDGLGNIVLEGSHVGVEGESLVAEVEDVRVYRVNTQPDFATLDEAREAFSGSYRVPGGEGDLYVGDTVVDAVIRYRSGTPVRQYALSSSLDPGLPGQEDTANVVLDYGPGGTRVFRSRGLLAEPVTVSRSAWSAFITFVKEGMRHILEGIDHVLFVICLVLGALQLRPLVWRITGFTLGHSVTLTAGFFGFVPSGAWFVPLVETGIALSIIYAAVIAIPAPRSTPTGERRMFTVTCAIGLLHGLGFSFVLHEILQVTSPDIWQSLLAFNVGVEIGQLLIILTVWPLFLLIRRVGETAWTISRIALATGCIALAGLWAGQRALSIFA